MVKNTNFQIQCRGRLLPLSKPLVMGILNLTPDSFYENSRIKNELDLYKSAEKMMLEGATFLDLGAYSSRPGAEHIDEQTEIDRLLPALQFLLKEFPDSYFSVDTFRSQVAEQALNAGADLINDISGGSLDSHMFTTVGKFSAPYVMMHLKGNPQTMVSESNYVDFLPELIDYFSLRIMQAQQAGIKDIIIDPGFGFAKNREHNYELLANLNALEILEKPILVGLSRKSMIYKLLQTDAEHALNGTTAAHVLAIKHGAKILRVHDVKPAMEAITICTEAEKYYF